MANSVNPKCFVIITQIMAVVIARAIKIVVFAGNQKRALVVAAVAVGPTRTTQAIDPSSNPLQIILLGFVVAAARAVRRALLIIVE